jgi:hypothetical protein
VGDVAALAELERHDPGVKWTTAELKELVPGLRARVRPEQVADRVSDYVGRRHVRENAARVIDLDDRCGARRAQLRE